MKTQLNAHIKENVEPSLFSKHLERLRFNEQEYLQFCQDNGFNKKFSFKTRTDLSNEIKAKKALALNQSLKEGKRLKVNLNKEVDNVFSGKYSGPYGRLKDIVDKEIKEEKENFLNFLKEVGSSLNLNFLLRESHYKISYLEVLIKIFQERPLWVRSIEGLKKNKTKNPERVLKTLIDHLFVQYKDFYHSCFFDFWFTKENKHLFFIDVSQGGSVVKSFRRYFKEDFTKKEILKIKEIPSGYTYSQVCLFLFVQRFGGSKRLFKALKFYSGGYTNQFKNFIYFMAKNETFLDFSQIRPLWDYVSHAGISNFKGRSLDNLLEAMDAWHKELTDGENVKFSSWDSSGLDFYEKEVENEKTKLKDVFFVKEVLNSVELKKEGKSQNHCVFSYLRKCQQGNCSIWTLKKRSFIGEVSSLITIEVQGRAVVQARGKYNRMPKPGEWKIIKDWAINNSLAISSRGGI